MSEWWLHGRGITQPVKAVTALAYDQWSAEQPDTGIWGAGETEAAALEDLRDALTAHLDVLDADTNLAPYLVLQRNWLRAHLGEAAESWSTSSVSTCRVLIGATASTGTGLTIRWPS